MKNPSFYLFMVRAIVGMSIIGLPVVSYAQTANEKLDDCFKQAETLANEFERLGTKESQDISAAKLEECKTLSVAALEETSKKVAERQKQFNQTMDELERGMKKMMGGQSNKSTHKNTNDSWKTDGSAYIESSNSAPGDKWAQGCIERAGGTVYCDSYAGFASTYGNLPSSCEANNGLICRMTLCELSTYLPIMSRKYPWVFDKRVLACSKDGFVKGRRQFYGFQNR